MHDNTFVFFLSCTSYELMPVHVHVLKKIQEQLPYNEITLHQCFLKLLRQDIKIATRIDNVHFAIAYMHFILSPA